MLKGYERNFSRCDVVQGISEKMLKLVRCYAANAGSPKEINNNGRINLIIRNVICMIEVENIAHDLNTVKCAHYSPPFVIKG